MLQVHQLTKAYSHGQFSLQDISFTIEPHSFTVLLGSSGAGKTSLLRCLPQLVSLDAGQVYFQGLDLTTASPRQLRQARQKMAMIAQQFNLVRRRTALENCLGGRLPELPLWRCLLGRFPEAMLCEALAALERVQLLDVAFQRADQLSGGQKQRVAIARALTQKAQLLLADEPIASLDPETAALVLQLLRSLCDEKRLTVICSLHQVHLAKRYGDRILGMRAGQIILDVPATAFNDEIANSIYQ
ncbi:phosphonate ABC transporter ATP-binding protein [Picosynechococcus sp. PCC 8807]|uniref:phosphonate ABC transporter ATP-binding protein n=1 Tax=Picosynechococcus sp. PCC 8807 TaxID=195248 RepID=UPI000810F02A|nr:phosphonate ABC transporter ATP-binding protein [Picosynechococcus sp. PCC 8807]ANV92208.1 phosphonate ABC transporter ATP-binding protein [Picosynechococcus sp. PCC 8807]